jgi:hypothetical protein
MQNATGWEKHLENWRYWGYPGPEKALKRAICNGYKCKNVKIAQL